MEQKDFTEQMRNDIISAAKNSFLKLGINAEVTIEFKEDRSLRVKLTTSKFNTTPVLYKSIYVYGNAELTPVDGHDGIYERKIWARAPSMLANGRRPHDGLRRETIGSCALGAGAGD